MRSHHPHGRHALLIGNNRYRPQKHGLYFIQRGDQRANKATKCTATEKANLHVDTCMMYRCLGVCCFNKLGQQIFLHHTTSSRQHSASLVSVGHAGDMDFTFVQLQIKQDASTAKKKLRLQFQYRDRVVWWVIWSADVSSLTHIVSHLTLRRLSLTTPRPLLQPVTR